MHLTCVYLLRAIIVSRFEMQLVLERDAGKDIEVEARHSVFRLKILIGLISSRR